MCDCGEIWTVSFDKNNDALKNPWPVNNVMEAVFNNGYLVQLSILQCH